MQVSQIAPFLLSMLPIIVLVAAIAAFKIPAWKAALSALAVGVAEAFLWRGLPAGQLARCTADGIVTGLFPIGLVIVAALFAHAVTEESGAIDDIKSGLSALSSDRRFLALLIAWGFGNFMEGMAGFGTAVAIPCAILVGVGFDPLRAILCCLVANTTPTAFGSVGVPTCALASETGLELKALTSYIAWLQLALTAGLPFMVLLAADGTRGLRECWKLALGASIAFLVPWLATALFVGCELPDVVGGVATMAFFAFVGNRRGIDLRRQLWAWQPFAFIVIALGVMAFIPQDHKPSPGFVVLAAGCIGGLCQGVRPTRLPVLVAKTAQHYSRALATICTVLALAKVMGASGMTQTFADGLVASMGRWYSAVAGTVGALGGFMTGSGTSTNVLFGSLQVSAASSEAQKFLFAAANVMGAGIGKMICPQSIVLGCATVGLAGRESEVMKRALPPFLVILAAACAITVLFCIFAPTGG